MKQAHHLLSVPVHGPGLYDVTGEVTAWLAGQGIRDGLLTVFVRHTSASLMIQENDDPDVRQDLETFFQRLVPEDNSLYRHTVEGTDDMPGHIKAALTQTQISIPVMDGRPAFGTWQGIFLFEHRRTKQRRELALHLIGE
jgi:secondary thiamine-phosphate synthase enzyme